MEDPELVESVAHQLQQMKWVSVALAPVHLLALWCVTAALFWSLGTLAEGTLRFRTALCIAAYAAVPTALGRALDLAVTWFQGPEFTSGMVPVLTSASSIAVLFPGLSQPEWLLALLKHVTVFSAWSAGLWAIGLREATPTTWGRAGFAAGFVWMMYLAAATVGEVISASLTRMTIPG
ncbi:MAG: hypothetical protein DHS20C21_17870 [Gemmatimonadota bacterium]|nr:MAG: hypothetical protein DHS20C21_17870 [Gemmatimonadota bacterium]